MSSDRIHCIPLYLLKHPGHGSRHYLIQQVLFYRRVHEQQAPKRTSSGLPIPALRIPNKFSLAITVLVSQTLDWQTRAIFMFFSLPNIVPSVNEHALLGRKNLFASGDGDDGRFMGWIRDDGGAR